MKILCWLFGHKLYKPPFFKGTYALIYLTLTHGHTLSINLCERCMTLVSKLTRT